jgi:Tfp pilus assembly protein FimT
MTSVHTRGASLIELIIYMALMVTILVVLYELFAISGTRKVNTIVQDDLYSSAERISADIQRTTRLASSVDLPLVGNSGSVLHLSSSGIVYQVDGNGILQKTEGGSTAALHTDAIVVDSITFTHVGPSVDSPTVIVEYTLRGVQEISGQSRTESYRTAVTVR